MTAPCDDNVMLVHTHYTHMSSTHVENFVVACGFGRQTGNISS